MALALNNPRRSIGHETRKRNLFFEDSISNLLFFVLLDSTFFFNGEIPVQKIKLDFLEYPEVQIYYSFI